MEPTTQRLRPDPDEDDIVVRIMTTSSFENVPLISHKVITGVTGPLGVQIVMTFLAKLAVAAPAALQGSRQQVVVSPNCLYLPALSRSLVRR